MFNTFRFNENGESQPWLIPIEIETSKFEKYVIMNEIVKIMR